MKIPPGTRVRIPPTAVLAFLLWLAVVSWSTLRPLSGLRLARHLPVPVTCVLCGSGGLTDVLLNVILFLPFGLIAPSLGWSWRRCAILCFLLTLGIETSQYLWLPGRDASLGDLLANTAGGLLGFLLAQRLGRPRKANAHTRHVRAIALLVTHAVIWLGSAALLRPHLIGPSPWHGGMLRSDSLPLSTVHAATFRGTAFASDSLTTFNPGPASDTLTLVLTQHSNAPELQRVVILRLRDANNGDLVMVDHGRSHLTLSLRLNAGRMHFRTPGWTISTHDRLPLGTPTQLQWSWQPRGVALTFAPGSDPGHSTQVILPFSVTLGWSLIHPFVSDINESAGLWSALWVAWWFGLLGWFASQCGWRARVGYGIAAMLVLIGAGLAVGWPVSMGDIVAGGVAYGISNEKREMRKEKGERRNEGEKGGARRERGEGRSEG